MSNAVAFPDSVPQEVRDFIIEFYAKSDIAPQDNADAHKIYSAQFLTEGAACVVPLGTFTTHAAIEGFRAQAWVGVPKRLHTPIAIFASPTGDLWGSGPADGVMIHGEVSFWPESGGENLGNPWAARMNFAKDGEGNIKLRRLQVFMTPKQK